MPVFQNILQTIGNTPVVRINKLAPSQVNLFAKVESFNPLGSVKDRLALGIIESAEKEGVLKPGMTVIEATSGNTGIGLAMVCAHKGYPLVVTMAENFSVERRKMLRFLGAKVVLTPAEKKGSGMLAKAVELSEKHGWFLCRQFENEANANIHSKTTAIEILEDFGDTKLDYWVTGYGTGGTLKGVASVLKRKSPETKVIVCEPDNSPLLASGLKQPVDPKNEPSHPAFRPHVVQGWTPDFIPKLTSDVIESQLIDDIVPINGEVALENAKLLAKQEGIFVGISAGATLSGAIEIAKEAPIGSNILCMFPDTGERYLSTQLFDGIDADMNDDEWAVSRSTDGYRFDKASPSKPKAPTEQVKLDHDAINFIEEMIQNKELPIIIFALEWCEFCDSIRKLLKAIKVDFNSIDLDSASYQKDGWGGKVRQALNAKTGCETIPQIFIGGEFVGGCTDLFDAFNSGKLEEKLRAVSVSYETGRIKDAYEMLPKWLQPR